MPDVRLTGGAELRALGRDLRAAGETGKGLRKELRAELKKAAGPVADDLKKTIQAIPVKDGVKRRSTGLRRRMAGAVKVRVSVSGKNASVKVVVDSAVLARTGQGKLPALLDGSKDFRHPVFQRTDRKTPWTDQKSHPYTGPVRARNQDAANEAAVKAIEIVADKLERGE